jgi:predicted nucleic acid-binding protein
VRGSEHQRPSVGARATDRPHPYFLDTSALAKLYMKEPGSQKLARWVGDRRRGFLPSVRLYVSRMVLPEAVSAITRRRNERKVASRGVLGLWSSVISDFVGDTLPYEIIEPTEAVALRAAFLVAAHGLRGYDAVQLASALWLYVRLDHPEALVFVCADNNLIEAARAEGLTAMNPLT